MIKEKLDLKIFIFIGIIILISLNFIPTGDDYFFINLQYDSIWDLFNDMKNGTLEMKDGSYLLTHNGRYLGNFLGITISKLGIHPSLYLVRSLIMGVGIITVSFLCSKLTIYNKKNTYLYSMILLLVAPVGIYREVYAWTAGYMNYLVPIISLLVCLVILKNFLDNFASNMSRFKVFLLILCGFITQLFMEHITIYMVILSVCVVTFCYVYNKEKIKIAVSFFISTLIGAIVMFSNSGYRSVVDSSDTYRSIATGLKELILKIISNGYEMSKFIVTDNLFLIVIILIICNTQLLKSHSNSNKWNKVNVALSLFIIIYSLGVNIIDKFNFNIGLGNMVIYLNIVTAILFIEIVFYTLVTSITDNKVKVHIIFYILSIIVLIIPLTIVSPIGARCFFICYVFMVIITLDLIDYIKENNLIVFNKFQFFIISISCIVIFNKLIVFHMIKNVYDERTEYIIQEMKKGESIIKIPTLPFKNYTQNDTDVFLSQYYYYKEIGDISFITLNYDEWKISIR